MKGAYGDCGCVMGFGLLRRRGWMEEWVRCRLEIKENSSPRTGTLQSALVREVGEYDSFERHSSDHSCKSHRNTDSHLKVQTANGGIAVWHKAQA